MDFLKRMQGLLDSTRAVDFLGPLALRLYLAPAPLRPRAGGSGFDNYKHATSASPIAEVLMAQR